MSPDLLPPPHSQPSHGRSIRRWRATLRSSPLRSGIFVGAVIFAGLIFYTTFLSPRGSLWLRPDWHGLSEGESLSLDLEHTSPSSPSPSPSPSPSTPAIPAETSLPSPSPRLISGDLTVEQIKDVVAPTRGFFARDYSLGLGWNNVSICEV
jgi:hypothetical protein